MGSDRNWMEDAACGPRHDYDPEMWFPEPKEIRHPRTRVALAICLRCPVAARCYEAGQREPFGIWGGTVKHRRL